MSSPTAQCLKRLQIELRKLAAEPDAGYQVGADPNNMLRCYFVMNGPEGTPYAGGRYVGLLEIPPDYPFKPPSVQLCTPSGRFRTGMAICLSNSSYHPEQWSPMWGLRTILIALVSFFVSNEATTGSMEGTDEDRRKYAANSRQYNVERIKTVYKRVLPDAYAKDVAYLERQRLGEEQDTATEPTGSDSDETAGDDDQRDADHAQKRTKAEASTGAADAVTGSSGTPPQKNDGAPSGGKALDGAEDAEAARRAGEGAEGREKPSDAEGTHRRHHHRSQHQHLSEQKTDTVFRLRDVPWRRWVSVAVLVVVALTLVEQVR